MWKNNVDKIIKIAITKYKKVKHTNVITFLLKPLLMHM